MQSLCYLQHGLIQDIIYHIDLCINWFIDISLRYIRLLLVYIFLNVEWWYWSPLNWRWESWSRAWVDVVMYTKVMWLFYLRTNDNGWYSSVCLKYWLIQDMIYHIDLCINWYIDNTLTYIRLLLVYIFLNVKWWYSSSLNWRWESWSRAWVDVVMYTKVMWLFYLWTNDNAWYSSVCLKNWLIWYITYALSDISKAW